MKKLVITDIEHDLEVTVTDDEKRIQVKSASGYNSVPLSDQEYLTLLEAASEIRQVLADIQARLTK